MTLRVSLVSVSEIGKNLVLERVCFNHERVMFIKGKYVCRVVIY